MTPRLERSIIEERRSDEHMGVPFKAYLPKTRFKTFLIFILCCIYTILFIPVVNGSTPLKEPIHLKAETFQYFKEMDIYIANGSVFVRQGATQIEADSVRLRGKTAQMDAFGNVHFFDGENKIDAYRMIYNTDTKLGILYDGQMFIKQENYYIRGEKIVRSAVNQYEIDTGSFTACDCQENPAWRFRTGGLRLTTNDYLFGRNVVFYIKKVPVFYFPYIIFPMKKERQTGLLVPHIGYSTHYGFRYEQDFFWAISKNQDATISFEHKRNKGDGLGLEYRYILSKSTKGQLNTRYFEDSEDRVNRWAVRYIHEQRFTNRVSGKLDVVYTNENDNFQDLSDKTADRALQNIESNLFLTYEGRSSFAYLLARYTQDLTSLSNDNTPQKLPEIGYSLIEYHPGNAPFYIDIDSSAVNFWSEGGLNLQRFDLYPKAALPIDLNRFATLTPWAGVRETWYRQEEMADQTLSREIIPIGITLEGQALKKWKETIHTVSATIFYENILVEGDSNLPQIDELDSLHDRHTITFSLMQRLGIPDKQGIPQEKGTFRLSESYHLDEIPSATLNSRRFSDLRAELEIRPWSQFSVKFDTFYDLYDLQIRSWNTDLRLSLNPYFNLSITQRSTRTGTIPKKGDLFNPYYLGDQESIAPKIDFLSEEISIATPWGIHLVNRIFYDVDQNEFVEVDYILKFQEQCWDFTLSYLDFHDREEFTFLITLKGLGTISPDN